MPADRARRQAMRAGRTGKRRTIPTYRQFITRRLSSVLTYLAGWHKRNAIERLP
jgi:hypothetical protein